MFDIEKFEATAKQSCPIYVFLGLTQLSVEGDQFAAAIPLTQDTGNHIGIMHAGSLFALGEFMGGLVTARHIADPVKFQPVVRDVSIDFKAPALTDITATTQFSEAQAAEMNNQLAETGKYDFQLTTELKDSNGTLVAQTVASYAIRNFSG